MAAGPPMSTRRSTLRLTTAQALVRYLAAQRTRDAAGNDVGLFGGVFAIFGHGNVAALGEALHAARDVWPTYRAHHEQERADTAIARPTARMPGRGRGGNEAAPSRVAGPGVAHDPALFLPMPYRSSLVDHCPRLAESVLPVSLIGPDPPPRTGLLLKNWRWASRDR